LDPTPRLKNMKNSKNNSKNNSKPARTAKKWLMGVISSYFYIKIILKMLHPLLQWSAASIYRLSNSLCLKP
jgi:hypothetical protein